MDGIYGNYGEITATAIANFPTQASGSITNVTNCDPNWQLGYVGTRTQWNVTPEFYIGFDINYTKLYTSFARLGVFRSPGTGPGSERPGGIYNIQNRGQLGGGCAFSAEFLAIIRWHIRLPALSACVFFA